MRAHAVANMCAMWMDACVSAGSLHIIFLFSSLSLSFISKHFFSFLSSAGGQTAYGGCISFRLECSLAHFRFGWLGEEMEEIASRHKRPRRIDRYADKIAFTRLPGVSVARCRRAQWDEEDKNQRFRIFVGDANNGPRLQNRSHRRMNKTQAFYAFGEEGQFLHPEPKPLPKLFIYINCFQLPLNRNRLCLFDLCLSPVSWHYKYPLKW